MHVNRLFAVEYLLFNISYVLMKFYYKKNIVKVIEYIDRIAVIQNRFFGYNTIRGTNYKESSIENSGEQMVELILY